MGSAVLIACYIDRPRIDIPPERDILSCRYVKNFNAEVDNQKLHDMFKVQFSKVSISNLLKALSLYQLVSSLMLLIIQIVYFIMLLLSCLKSLSMHLLC